MQNSKYTLQKLALLLFTFLFLQKHSAAFTYNSTIIDEEYGIDFFDKYNSVLDGDSLRVNEFGQASQGWVKDYYDNQSLLHKGYYINGKLRVYKNYYPDGKLEREFKYTGTYKCSLKKYFPNGELKTSVTYINGEVSKWEDFFPNGNVAYREIYNATKGYIISRLSFNDKGLPELIMTLKNKKEMTYRYSTYFESGIKEEEGEMIYNSSVNDYVKNGVWKLYNEKGEVVTTENFN